MEVTGTAGLHPHPVHPYPVQKTRTPWSKWLYSNDVGYLRVIRFGLGIGAALLCPVTQAQYHVTILQPDNLYSTEAYAVGGGYQFGFSSDNRLQNRPTRALLWHGEPN